MTTVGPYEEAFSYERGTPVSLKRALFDPTRVGDIQGFLHQTLGRGSVGMSSSICTCALTRREIWSTLLYKITVHHPPRFVLRWTTDRENDVEQRKCTSPLAAKKIRGGHVRRRRALLKGIGRHLVTSCIHICSSVGQPHSRESPTLLGPCSRHTQFCGVPRGGGTF